jgi:hypothetical protein
MRCCDPPSTSRASTANTRSTTRRRHWRTPCGCSGAVAGQLTRYPPLADLLGERHRIIANDWRSADLQRLIGRLLGRAAALLDAVDFEPAALRADLRTPARLLFSVVEILNHAVDLTTQSAALVHDNERRWRVFRERTAGLVEPEAGDR